MKNCYPKPPEMIFVKTGMTTKARDGTAVMLTSGASGRISAFLSLRSLISAFFLILLLPFRWRKRCAVPESPEKCSGKEEKAPATIGKVVRVPAAMVPMKSVAAVVDKDVAARRAMAIKRVEEDNGGGDYTAREYSLFITSRGDTNFTRSWTPLLVQVRWSSI